MVVIVSSQMSSCLLPTPPAAFQYSFAPVFLLHCHTLFSLFDLSLNSSIKNFSFLSKVGELALFSFLPSLDETFLPCPWSFIQLRIGGPEAMC